MAAYIKIAHKRYIGAAADAKPTGIEAGSTAWEYDTQKLWITDDGSTWRVKEDLFTRFGEVSATPTANTLLGRLKDLLTGVVLAAGSAIIGKIRIVTALGDEATDDTLDAVKTVAHFGGATYVKSDTATDDTARRFETTAKKLRDVVVRVATNNQLLGTSASQVYPVNVGETVGFGNLEVSTLYFKNAGAGLNGTVQILAVEE